MKRFFPFIIIFMLLCGPRLKFPDLNILFTLLLVPVSLLLIAWRYKIEKNILFLLYLLVLSLIFSIITVLINDSISYVPIVSSLSVICSFFAAYSVVYIYRLSFNDENYIEKITHDIMVSYLINCIFVVLVMVVPAVKKVATTLLSQNEKMIALANESVRSLDLVMGGGAVASIVFSVFFVLSILTWLKERSVFSVICLVFSVFGMLLTGRTGLVFSIVFIIPVILSYNYLNKGKVDIINVTSTLMYVLLIFSSFMLSCLIIFRLSYPEEASLIIEKSMDWALEPYRNLFLKGSLESESTSSLVSMYRNYDVIFEYLSFFGTSLSGRDIGNYFDSDIGYLRILYTSGFVGALMIFFKYFYLLLKYIEIFSKRNYPSSVNLILITAIYYIFVIFITNIKEYHDVIRSGTPLLMIFSILILSQNRVVK
ncbi:membrane hypothetical protein [Vibrio crassostreae]|nr:membrane hypothetical protein [Vibrio crassostreae]CAK2951645.1 membrane hypothetical protein [Vibrio crassostreae]CAK2952638.1 membrane hypothetical protein [Vibrio crassostreae]CAK2953138.1 membrane hypothetical protein [Vibrio crassostreae]CAK2955136.1 membrane hypothetical protein [Vibrio crassostreae]